MFHQNKPPREKKITPERLRKDNKEDNNEIPSQKLTGEAEEPQDNQAPKEEAPKTTKKKVKYKKSRKSTPTEAKTDSVTTTSTTKTDNKANELSPLTKRKTFAETHTRITTYLENEVNDKLRKLSKELNIPVKELINKSLKEFFNQYNL